MTGGVTGLVGALVVLFLPGAWVTFGLPLTGLSFWMRLLGGLVLSPLVAFVQFYLLRWVGLDFTMTATVMVLANAPVVWTMRRVWPGRGHIAWGLLLGWATVAVVPLALFTPLVADSQTRAYSSHNWMHGAIVQQLANETLRLEEPSLAGVRLAYPWAGHVYQGVVSYLLDAPVVTSYVWVNILWLLAILALGGSLATQLGGGPRARILTVVWLAFGVNITGYTLARLLPTAIVQEYPVWGDNRYTPWLLKFYFFEQMIFGLGMLAMLMYLLVTGPGSGPRWARQLLAALLIAGTGIVYPLLLPVGAVLVAACLLVDVWEAWSPTDFPGACRRLWVRHRGFIMLALAAALASWAHLEFVAADRIAGSGVMLSSVWHMKRKAVETVVVFLPMIAAVGLVSMLGATIRWGMARRLLLASLGIWTLGILISIPYVTNEYKFVFVTAWCLAPFPALVVERLLIRQPLAATVGVSLALAAVLSLPLVHRLEHEWPWGRFEGPAVDVSHFELTLARTEALSSLVEVIRRQTPRDAVLVLNTPASELPVYLPTLTGRSLYVPPDPDDEYPGVSLSNHFILDLARGYDPAVSTRRAQTTSALFDPSDLEGRAAALRVVSTLGRPLAVVERPDSPAGDDAWWKRVAGATLIHDGPAGCVWLVAARKPEAP